jgi:SAM-dependent methyltransferase
MQFLTSKRIMEIYGISAVTVSKWTNDAVENENNLQLERFNKKLRVLDNTHNHNELNRLSEIAKNYSKDKVKETFPELDDIFTVEEQIQLASDLEYHKEINLKFDYKSKGATIWDKLYLDNMDEFSKHSNMFLNNFNNFQDLGIEKYNLIDIGCGNGWPVKRLINSKSPKNYIALDISPDMIDICQKNIITWFPKLNFEKDIVDIENSFFGNVFLKYKYGIPNIILLFGGTIGNFYDRVRIFKNFASGMTKEDYFVFNGSLDTEDNKSDLDYARDDKTKSKAWIPRKLGIDVINCEADIYYDKVKKCKIKTLVLDKDYVINFDIHGQIKRTVQLYRGDKIVRWRHYLQNNQEMIGELEEAGFKVVLMKNVGMSSFFICQLNVK